MRKGYDLAVNAYAQDAPRAVPIERSERKPTNHTTPELDLDQLEREWTQQKQNLQEAGLDTPQLDKALQLIAALRDARAQVAELENRNLYLSHALEEATDHD